MPNVFDRRVSINNVFPCRGHEYGDLSERKSFFELVQVRRQQNRVAHGAQFRNENLDWGQALVSFAHEVAVPRGNFNLEVSFTVRNALTSQSRLKGHSWGVVDLIEFLVEWLVTSLKTLFDQNMAGRAGRNSPAGVVDVDPMGHGNVQNAARKARRPIRNFCGVHGNDLVVRAKTHLEGLRSLRNLAFWKIRIRAAHRAATLQGGEGASNSNLGPGSDKEKAVMSLLESQRRRTFAIISHPDAGKTTLTEKFLLYGGAIREAGEVKAKAQRRKTTSDWMKLEQERGISVTSSVLQFDYRGLKINLLDTPGHQDFSEDTYRTLMAADSAVMVIDAAKGVETQTLKLFDVCRMRGVPIFTFFNKMDREARDPLELLEEVESVLKIGWNPLTWPIGMGPRFKGVYHRIKREFQAFESAEKAGQMAQLTTLKCEPNSPELDALIGDDDLMKKFREDMELIDNGVGPFDRDAFLAGKLSPAIFGSAKNNFGIPTFLDIFHDIAPQPTPKAAKPQAVDPTEDRFSAFVFKIQANMDKAHRDRMAFMRICSGKFSRDMDVKHARLQKTVRLSHSKQFLAQDRQTVDEAFAGDVVGIHDPGHFRIGDTVYTGPLVEFAGIPQFSPEIFGKLRIRDPLKRKQLQKGVEQLCEEGLVQMFIQPHVGTQDPILGVVGVLQFEVMVYRLKDEYGVDAILDRLPYSNARWVRSDDPNVKIEGLDLRIPMVRDGANHWVALFSSDWEIAYTQKNAPAALKWFNNSYEANLLL